MAYALTLLGILGAFIWFTPARDSVGTSILAGTRAALGAASEQSGPMQEKASELGSVIRTKAMEILRKQLHTAIEETVK